MRLKFDSLSSLPSITHFLNNAFRAWLDKIADDFAHMMVMMAEKTALVDKLVERVDYMSRKNAERQAKINANTRHMEALRMTSQGEDSRLRQQIEKLEKDCAKCNCHVEKKPKPKAKSKGNGTGKGK